MTNHWHLVAWPEFDGQLSDFTGWLTLTHTQRWHARRHSTGSGHVYQGRFKSFPVQDDNHFYTVCRYVERNALKANLVKSAASDGTAFIAGCTEQQPTKQCWPRGRCREGGAGWIM